MSDKKSKEVKPVILGRFGTQLKIGILGLPNVGKSSFFNILTSSQAAVENYPFCTIDPNEARVPVPDSRWDYLCDVYKPLSKVPAFLSVVDIAGLVKGANEGQGLGNAFLSHVSACDAIYHMIRIFDDEEIIHVEGEVDPIRDIEIIYNELRLKDLEFVKKRIEALEKNVLRGGGNTNPETKKQKEEYDILCKIQKILEDEQKHLRLYKCEWNEKEIEVLNKHLFLTTKPMIYLINMSETDFLKKKSKWLPRIAKWIKENDPGAQVIPFSAAYENKLLESGHTDTLNGAVVANGDASSAPGGDGNDSQLNKIIVNGFKALNLQYFFTAGHDEVKAWTIQQGTKAPQAAGKIHTHFEKGFIMADVMNYQDFHDNNGNEVAVKAAGKYRQQGRNYVVNDGDIIHFKFNAGAGLTTAKK